MKTLLVLVEIHYHNNMLTYHTSVHMYRISHSRPLFLVPLLGSRRTVGVFQGGTRKIRRGQKRSSG